MSENVVYKQPNQENQQNPPVAEASVEQAAPAEEASAEVQTDASNQMVEDQSAESDTTSVEDSAPPPGMLGGGLIKKALIGIVALVIIVFIIILLIPKGHPQKAVTLQWWGLWEDSSTMQPIIQDFEKAHPNITVVYTKNDPNQYLDRLQTRIQGGNGPDIFLYHNTWLPVLSADLPPLSTDVITPDTFKSTFYPVMQQDLVQNGAIYGIPQEADTVALFVNPSLFEAAGVQVPTNWDDFVKASKQLTVKDQNGKIKTAGAALGTYDNINHAPDIISLLFLQQGVQMNNFSNSSDNESQALQFYTSFSQGQDNTWDVTLDNSLLSFSKGNLAMYFGYSWDVFALQKLNPNLQFKIYPVPNLYGKSTTVASYWVNGVSTKSPNQTEAMEFMQFLAQQSTAQQFYTQTAKTRAFGEPYARKDLQASLKENQLVYPFVSQLDGAGSSFFASNTDDGDTGINTQMNQYLQTAIDSIVNDGNSANSAVSDLQNGVSQVQQKYGQQ